MRKHEVHRGVIAPNTKPRATRVVRTKRRIKHDTVFVRMGELLAIEDLRICIYRRLGGIGDVIMTTPALKHLKRVFPHCHLTYATDTKYAQHALKDVLLHNPYIDRLVDYRKIGEKNFHYEADVTATGLSRERPGTIPPNRIDMFAERIGVDVSSDPVPDFILLEEERFKATEVLKSISNIAMTKFIAVHSTSNDPRRTWPISYTEELVNRLAANENIHVLIFDWRTDKKWPKTDNITPMIDVPIRECAAIIEQCELTICPDSSILHIAGALKKKILGIFGTTPPESRINHYVNATAITAGLSCQQPSPCVVGESLVLVNGIYRKISDIVPGDKVLCANGEINTVTKLHENDRADRELLEFNIFGSNEPITVTEDHKLLVANRSYSWKVKDYTAAGKKRTAIAKISEPEWIQAKDIKEKQYCCIPVPKESKEKHFLDNPKYHDVLWLLGLFLAEGWTTLRKNKSKYKISFAVSSEEEYLVDKITSVMNNHPSLFISGSKQKEIRPSTEPNSRGNSIIIKTRRKHFLKLLYEIFDTTVDINAHNKKIPPFLFTASEETIKVFLDAYFDGDGYREVKNKKTTGRVYSTVSRELAYGVQLLYARLGKVAKIYKRKRDTNYKEDAIIYRIFTSDQERVKRWYKDKDYLYVPIKEIKKSNRTDSKVYDITVENDTTFTVQNLAVFDCWYSSICVKQRHGRLECYTKLLPEAVYETAIRKLNSKEINKKNIGTVQVETSRKSILVKRRHGGFGDITMSIPGIEGLAKEYPNTDIYYALPKEYHAAAENNPVIKGLVDIKSNIDQRQYKAIMDISSPCAYYEFQRLKAGKKVEKSRVEVFAEALGTSKHLPVENKARVIRPKYYVSKKEKAWAGRFIPHVSEPTIGLVLKCAEQYRDWNIEKYYELATAVCNDYRVVIIDTDRNYEFDRCVDACGFPFRKSAALIGECDVVVTPDTAHLHIAQALNIPTVALFGPIDPVARVKGYKDIIVVTSDMECLYCWRNSKTPCKTTGNMHGYSKCMESISVKTVLKVLRDMVG